MANGQQCAECGSPREYISGTTTLDDKRNGGLNNNRWSGSGDFSAGQIAKFSGNNVGYTWAASDFNLGGVILENGADLTLNRDNQGDNPSFTITNGCIVVGAGSILNLIYITKLENITICVEDGGQVKFDSRSGARNDFTLDQVVINLQGPNANIDFGEAEIIIEERGLEITGWTGNESDLCENSNPPIPGRAGNISWTDKIQHEELCKILNGRILPIELLYFSATKSTDFRTNLLKWETSKEWGNSHFEIERAINNLEEWKTVGRVEGNGYSNEPIKYNFLDSGLPITAGNIFYRLKQVDYTGNYSYSKTIAIQLKATNSKNTWLSYPNPSTMRSGISVDLLDVSQYQDELITISLSNMMGQRQSFLINSPGDISQIVSEWLLFKNSGIYILEIRWGENSQQIKLLRN